MARGSPGHDHPVPASRHDPVNVTVAGPTATVELSGDFDMAATFTVEPALEQVLDEPGVRAIELDLSALRFIDSTGIGVLLRVDSEARQRGVALSIVPGPREVQRVFEVTGVSEALPFSESPSA